MKSTFTTRCYSLPSAKTRIDHSSAKSLWTAREANEKRRNPRRGGWRSLICQASETTNKKLIASSDIPVVYPRSDFTLQLYRWAKIDAEADGLSNFGSAFTVSPVYKTSEEDGELLGFDAFVVRDGNCTADSASINASATGERMCQIGVYMDEEKVEKHEFVGIGEDRFPINEGRVDIIDGKALEIW